MVSERPITSRLAVVARPEYVEALRAIIARGKATCMVIARLFHWSQPRAWRCLESLRLAGLIERQGHHAGAMYIPCLDEVEALFKAAMTYICCQNSEAPV